MSDRAAAIAWAQELWLHPELWLVLDTETTGLGSDAEIVQLALLAPNGTPVVETLIRPQGPIPPDAVAIHGITESLVADAPTYAECYAYLLEAVRGRRLVSYNAAFDVRMLAQTGRRFGLGGLPSEWDCAMQRYAAFIGQHSFWPGQYKWQPLPGRARGGYHSALEDCRLVLALLRQMADAT